MITLADLRRALEHALTHPTNPAILRLPEGGCTFSPDCQEGVSCFRRETPREWCDSNVQTQRTVEGLARAYLPRRLSNGYLFVDSLGMAEHVLREPLDLTDPGTAHALLVALALARGYDPGVAGLGVMWERAGECWMLTTASQSLVFEPADDDHDIAEGDSTISCLSWLCAPSVAAELDTIKALSAALLHVCP